MPAAIVPVTSFQCEDWHCDHHGNIEGGSGFESGTISSDLATGTVLIKGSVIGGTGSFTGKAALKTLNLTVNGSVVGGVGNNSGTISAGPVNGATGTLVKVLGSIRGGSGTDSGLLSVGNLTTLTVNGSLIGGTGDRSGRIAAITVNSLTINGNIQGGSATGSADLTDSGSVTANSIQTLLIGGSVIAGTDNTTGTFERNGSLRVTTDIGSATIKGSLRGNSTHNVTIAAYGALNPTATTDVAIGSLTVNRRVEYTQILAGYTLASSPTRNADAQIGTITVDGDWYASSVSTGVSAGLDGRYGTSDDVKYSGADVKDVATVSSKIGNLTIKGRAFGTTALGDNFGVVAENFGIININGNNIPLTAGNNNDDFFIGFNSQMLGADFRLNEI